MPENVKYPFEDDDGRWSVRYHIPYTVEHEGQSYGVVASIYREPAVHGSILVTRGGQPVARPALAGHPRAPGPAVVPAGRRSVLPRQGHGGLT